MICKVDITSTTCEISYNFFPNQPKQNKQQNRDWSKKMQREEILRKRYFNFFNLRSRSKIAQFSWGIVYVYLLKEQKITMIHIKLFAFATLKGNRYIIN